jgi:hypothetical protein
MNIMAYEGWRGKVYSGATDMDVTEWSLDEEISEIDVTTTAGGGAEQTLPGPTKISGKFTIFYTTEKNPYSSSIALTPKLKPTLKLYVSDTEFFQGVALITKASPKSAVKDAVSVEISFRNDGVWTHPGE